MRKPTPKASPLPGPACVIDPFYARKLNPPGTGGAAAKKGGSPGPFAARDARSRALPDGQRRTAALSSCVRTGRRILPPPRTREGLPVALLLCGGIVRRTKVRMAVPERAGSSGFLYMTLSGSGPKGVGVSHRNSAIAALRHRQTRCRSRRSGPAGVPSPAGHTIRRMTAAWPACSHAVFALRNLIHRRAPTGSRRLGLRCCPHRLV